MWDHPPHYSYMFLLLRVTCTWRYNCMTLDVEVSWCHVSFPLCSPSVYFLHFYLQKKLESRHFLTNHTLPVSAAHTELQPAALISPGDWWLGSRGFCQRAFYSHLHISSHLHVSKLLFISLEANLHILHFTPAINRQSVSLNSFMPFFAHTLTYKH